MSSSENDLSVACGQDSERMKHETNMITFNLWLANAFDVPTVELYRKPLGVTESWKVVLSLNLDFNASDIYLVHFEDKYDVRIHPQRCGNWCKTESRYLK